MKVICWNVAGIRAAIKKGALDFLIEEDWDVVCLQETKAEEAQVKLPEAIKEKYPHRYWRSTKGTTQRKGLSGTTIWSRVPVLRELEPPAWDEEGRITAVAFPFWNLVTVYTPNSQAPGAERNVYRVETWDPQFREYVRSLNAQKPTIVCGDFNAAHMEIDVAKPEDWKNTSVGFLDQERLGFARLLGAGFHDVLRERNPEQAGLYTFWDQKIPAFRKYNKGWRIDYFLVPGAYRKKVSEAGIRPDVTGSDHCPITLEFDERRPLRLAGD